MENNVIFICPSWEERSYLGFLKDCDDTAPNKVVVIKKVRPINEQEIVNSINSIIDACSNRHIDYEIIEWKEASPDNWGKLQTRLNGLLTTDNRIHLDITTIFYGLCCFSLVNTQTMLMLGIISPVLIMKHG